MIWLSFVLVGCATGSTQTGSVEIPLRKEPLGANIDGVVDWSRTLAFVDLMKQSRPFGSPEKPWEEMKGGLDKNGWPTRDFGVVLMAALNGVTGLGGIYKIKFEAAAQPQISDPGNVGKVQNIRKVGSGYEADLVMPEKFEQLFLSFTNTKGGVRNLQVLRPVESVNGFDRRFVDHVKRFATLRFMDWGKTNNNLIEKWEDRPTLSSPSFSYQYGVPYETMIDLANLVKTDAWICVPAHANQTYVKNLAMLCAKRLDKSLNLYVEYSNEVWNWSFEQAQFNLQQAKANSAGEPDVSWDGKGSDWTWPARRIAKQTALISKEFKAAFGADSARVRPVLAAQIVWPDNWLAEGLNYLEHNYGSPNKVVYGFAGAPYFNLESLKGKKEFSKAEALASLEESIKKMPEWGHFSKHKSWKEKYKLHWLAYEGGPDTFGPDSIEAKKASQLDPKIKELVKLQYKMWKQGGGELFNYFVCGATGYDSQYGTWGLTDDMNKRTPKIEAIDDILAGKF